MQQSQAHHSADPSLSPDLHFLREFLHVHVQLQEAEDQFREGIGLRDVCVSGTAAL
jgi:hypothetical protein